MLLCQNEPIFGGKHIWKVLYWVSSKQNERWATEAQLSAEPLVYIGIDFLYYGAFPVPFNKCIYQLLNEYWPTVDASYHVSYHLAKRFQRKSCFRNRPIRNKNCLWWPCLSTDQNRMSNSHRGSSIDASFHVSVHFCPLKPLGQMNWNLVGSIYGRFSIMIAHFIPIHYQTWLPQAILVSAWFISLKILLHCNVNTYM
jgi:hypothetical protein